MQAILWSTSNSQGLQLVSSLASFVVLLFGVVKFAPPGQPVEGWFREGINASHALGFMLASLVCVGVGTIGFANLRYGREIDVSQVVELVSRLLPKTSRTTPVSSPWAAQHWFEWNERGYVMPVGTALIGVVSLVIACFIAPEELVDFVGGISLILLTPALVVGIFLGARSENGEFGSFNGSRPLTDSQVANAVLTSATVGVVASALIWAIFMAAVMLILHQRTGQSFLQSMIEQFESNRVLGFATLGIRPLGFVTLCIGAIWGVVALMTSLVLAGKKVVSVAIFTLMGIWIAGGYLLAIEAQETFQLVFRWAVILLSLVGIATAYVASWKLRLISRNTLVLAACIVAAMIAAAHLCQFTSELDSTLAVLWGSCLTPSALAVAPLAVWWNRHR